jgi:tetratricopeptide (TPR) repeat protein
LSAGRTPAWLPLPLLAALAPAPEPLFATREVEGQLLVRANRAAVPCDLAIDELGRSLGWQVRYGSTTLREQLAEQVVDLSFDAMPPRICAQLIAAAAGADASLVERPGGAVDLVVVPVPDAGTEAGRERLRSWALDWYGQCLARAGADAADEASVRVRMHMADLLRARGQLEAAADLLEQLHALAPEHPYVPVALLRIAETRFELGPEHWVEAERRALDLTRLHPSRPEAAVGSVLLGRILLAQGRAAECAAMLERAFLRLADQPEIVDVYLLVAAARYRLGDPAGVQKAIATLDGGHDLGLLDPAQQAERSFLAAYAQLEAGRPRRAALSLERWFALAAEQDPRRGEALVLLGRAYQADGRFLQARAAAVAARQARDRLDRRRAREAAQLFAETAMALGDPQRALAELEDEVRRDPEQEAELTLFLAGSLIDEGRHARAIGLLELLAGRADAAGDAARLLRIEARFAQSAAIGDFAAFVAEARPQVGALTDPGHQRRAVELLGRAFEALGEPERAADAYRGILR